MWFCKCPQGLTAEKHGARCVLCRGNLQGDGSPVTNVSDDCIMHETIERLGFDGTTAPFVQEVLT